MDNHVKRNSDDPAFLWFGESLWDVFPDGACPDSALANHAVYAQASGIRSALVSAVGTDHTKDKFLREFPARGISKQCVTWVPKFVGAVGAGSAFSGGFLLGVLRGKSWEDAVQVANELAARVCGCTGTRLPTQVYV